MECLLLYYDSPWKEVLEEYFEDFLEFFFPGISCEIDWEKGHTFLDKELQQVVQDAELGRRLADKLVQVWRKGGNETWVLIHVEVQGQERPNFAKRMFVYNYRIFDRYDRPVVSLALLADQRPGWRPDSFGYELWGCKVGIEFPVVKVTDYAGKWEELEADPNPFAVCVMAYMKAQETHGNVEDRKRWKLYLARRLYEKGYQREDIIRLFRFIDWIMRLPEELEESFWQDIRQYEEAKKVEYITSVERIGIKKGMQKGMQQGMQQGILQSAREAVMDILELRFGVVPESMLKRLNEIHDPSILKMLHRKAVKVDSLEGFGEVIDLIMK